MVSENGTVVATFIYDGDGNRIKKMEAGETVLYVNKYYEKNLTSGNVTTSYYLGSRLVAQREGEEVRFIHQDHLSGTSLTTTDNGTVISSITYFPFGECRNSQGDPGTDRLFTGQLFDKGTGLYYYGARYYDPLIGRFISPDPFVFYPDNPQSFNRYAYCLNNPLRYIDPTGYYTQEEVMTVPGLGGVDLEIVEKVIEGAEPSPQNPSQPDLPIEDDDETWLIVAGGISLVLLADDVIPVVGWVDDLAIPIVFGVFCKRKFPVFAKYFPQAPWGILIKHNLLFHIM